MKFFTGLHQPSDAKHVSPAFISVNRLRTRKRDFVVGEWIMDSGAFSTILLHGGYSHPPSEYADQIKRWKRCGKLLAAVSQDYMCEPMMLQKTGLSIAQHQSLTIERYCALVRANTGAYIMPVLQGYDPSDYVRHVRMYASRLLQGAWVGVGSICKRNGDPGAIYRVLTAILEERPDLRLHGFGLKTTALEDWGIRSLLHSADSMAWSYAVRRQGRSSNDWREAACFAIGINSVQPEAQERLFA